MPNWCSNTLIINGENKRLKEFKQFAQGRPTDWGNYTETPEDYAKFLKTVFPLSFNRFCPVPAHILKKGYNDAGHGWCSVNWGTKWDVGKCHQVSLKDDELTYAFDTAWGPPDGAIDWMQKVFPDLKFLLEFTLEEEMTEDGDNDPVHEYEPEEPDEIQEPKSPEDTIRLLMIQSAEENVRKLKEAKT